MIQIYLCEDQEKQLFYFKRIIEKYIIDTYKEAEVVSARKDPQHILSDVKKYGKSPALFFIDIQLDGYSMDGFQLSRELKRNLKDSYIVFLTSREELAYKAFLVNIFLSKKIHVALPSHFLEYILT